MPSSSPTPMSLTEAQRGLLATYAFDAQSFEHLRQELAAGRFTAARNQVTDVVTAPSADDLVPWPEAHSAQRARCIELGQAAIAAGEVAVAILNGGMATRFGGVVKGIVPVDGEATFLAIKLKSVAQAGRRVPVFLMNSFATQAATQEHLKQLSSPALPEVHCVCQSISMRLTPEGALFKDANNEPSFYAPGHGDLLTALSHSAEYQQFVRQGGKYVAISNVDNLAATLSPLVIGAHIAGHKDVTVEVAPRQDNDSGGAPVRRQGKLEVLEGFRFPNDFPMNTLPVFNTNSFVFSHTAVRDDYPFTWFRADKKVEGAPVVQFERLVGEVTSYVPAMYLQVPREGPECRFLPVKAPGDLPGILPWVRKQLLPPPPA